LWAVSRQRGGFDTTMAFVSQTQPSAGRQITGSAQDTITHEKVWYVGADGRLI